MNFTAGGHFNYPNYAECPIQNCWHKTNIPQICMCVGNGLMKKVFMA